MNFWGLRPVIWLSSISEYNYFSRTSCTPFDVRLAFLAISFPTEPALPKSSRPKTTQLTNGKLRCPSLKNEKKNFVSQISNQFEWRIASFSFLGVYFTNFRRFSSSSSKKQRWRMEEEKKVFSLVRHFVLWLVRLSHFLSFFSVL